MRQGPFDKVLEGLSSTGITCPRIKFQSGSAKAFCLLFIKSGSGQASWIQGLRVRPKYSLFVRAGLAHYAILLA
ncbi:unnamed protein product [Arabis nemorensis]|uniref:Uncharacterized protein n=1 Tax=Arabis nemorensis TaxID=586526 RepID=A0A565BVS3_9BRAS|nr:unnamed protein product [Arabis nemorensis]